MATQVAETCLLYFLIVILNAKTQKSCLYCMWTQCLLMFKPSGTLNNSTVHRERCSFCFYNLCPCRRSSNVLRTEMYVHGQGEGSQLEPTWALGHVSAAAWAEKAAYFPGSFTRATSGTAHSRLTDVRHRWVHGTGPALCLIHRE